MGLFLLIMGLVILVGIINVLQNESRHHGNSSRSQSYSANTNSTDLMSTGAIVSLQDTAKSDCRIILLVTVIHRVIKALSRFS